MKRSFYIASWLLFLLLLICLAAPQNCGKPYVKTLPKVETVYCDRYYADSVTHLLMKYDENKRKYKPVIIRDEQ